MTKRQPVTDFTAVGTLATITTRHTSAITATRRITRRPIDRTACHRIATSGQGMGIFRDRATSVALAEGHTMAGEVTLAPVEAESQSASVIKAASRL